MNIYHNCSYLINEGFHGMGLWHFTDRRWASNYAKLKVSDKSGSGCEPSC
jgi:hypothetical protein